MGCCCCSEETPRETPRQSDFSSRSTNNNNNNNNTFYSSTSPNQRQFTFTSRQTRTNLDVNNPSQQTRSRSPDLTASNEGQCQFCGNVYDPSLLYGHQETCRINLKKKASEMRNNNGEIIKLKVFELDPTIDYADEVVCVVCMNALRSYAIIPCGHLIACGLCAKKLDVCPMCRKERQGLLYIDVNTLTGGGPSCGTDNQNQPSLKQSSCSRGFFSSTLLCKSCKNVIHPAFFDGHREVCAMRMRQLKRDEEEAEAKKLEREHEEISKEPKLYGEHQTVEMIQENEEKRSVKNDVSKNQTDIKFSPASSPSSSATPLLKIKNTTDSVTQAPVVARSSVSIATEPPISNTKGESPLCIECRRAPVTVAFVPCGHCYMCDACGEKASICPVCCIDIRGRIHAYL